MLKKTKIFLMRQAILEDVNSWHLDDLIEFITNDFLCKEKSPDVEELNFTETSKKGIDFLQELEYTDIDSLREQAKSILKENFCSYNFEDYEKDYEYIIKNKEL